MSLGNCAYLNGCFNMDTCKFVHYQLDRADERRAAARGPDQKQAVVRTCVHPAMAVHFRHALCVTVPQTRDVISTHLDSADLRTYPPQV